MNNNTNNLIHPNNNIQYANENSNIQNNTNVSQPTNPIVGVQNNQEPTVAQPTVPQAPTVQTNLQTQNVESVTTPHPHVDMEAHIKNQLQNIPTVEQNKQDFINNVQNMNQETTEQKKEGVNFIFIIILFIIILAAIYFLFPILLKYI